MKQRRESQRNMCAELVAIRWTDADGCQRTEPATLEDISATGVCLHLEHLIEPDTVVTVVHPTGVFQGTVKYCTYEEIGYFLGVAFEDGYRWSKTDFQPSHLLELPANLIKFPNK
jgi:hypothetical protein